MSGAEVSARFELALITALPSYSEAISGRLDPLFGLLQDGHGVRNVT